MGTGWSVTCKTKERRMLLAWVKTFLIGNMLLAEAYGSGGEITIFLPAATSSSRKGKAPYFLSMAWLHRKMIGNEAFSWFLLSYEGFFFFSFSFPCQWLAAPYLPLRTKASSHFLFLFPCLGLMSGWNLGFISPTKSYSFQGLCTGWLRHRPSFPSVFL